MKQKTKTILKYSLTALGGFLVSCIFTLALALCSYKGEGAKQEIIETTEQLNTPIKRNAYVYNDIYLRSFIARSDLWTEVNNDNYIYVNKSYSNGSAYESEYSFGVAESFVPSSNPQSGISVRVYGAFSYPFNNFDYDYNTIRFGFQYYAVSSTSSTTGTTTTRKYLQLTTIYLQARDYSSSGVLLDDILLYSYANTGVTIGNNVFFKVNEIYRVSIPQVNGYTPLTQEYLGAILDFYSISYTDVDTNGDYPTFTFPSNYNPNFLYYIEVLEYNVCHTSTIAEESLTFNFVFSANNTIFSGIKFYYSPTRGVMDNAGNKINLYADYYDTCTTFTRMSYIRVDNGQEQNVAWFGVGATGSIDSVYVKYYKTLEPMQWANDQFRTITIYNGLDSIPYDYDRTTYYASPYVGLTIKEILQYNGSLISSSSLDLGSFFTVMSSAFAGLKDLLSIAILPNITLGLLLFLPLISGIIILIVWIVKR